MSQTIRKLFSRAAMMLLATILLTMTAQTAWAQLTMNGVKYIDANGVEQTRDGVIVLTGSETKLGVEGTENSPTETWYLCNTNLSYNSTLSSYDYCNVNIILADGVEMSVEPSSSSAIYILGSLGIYGQSTGTNRGALTAKGTSRGIWVNGSGNNVTISGAEVTATGDYAIYSSGGGVSITGSKVTATGTERGIFANGDDNGDVNLTIIGSEVTATATGTSGNAIFSWGGSISISDAEVTAEGNYAIYTLRGGVSITGGKVTANGTEYGIEASGSNKDITIKEGAEVTAEGKYAIYAPDGGVSITGGKVTANGASYAIGAWGSDKDITIIIIGAEVTATANGSSGYAIYTPGGGISITGGKVTAKGTSYGIEASGMGKDITIKDAEVKAEGNYAIYTPGGGISITGGKVTANGTSTGIYAYKGGAFSNCTISGEVGIAVSNSSSAAVTIGAGVEINGYTKAGIKNYGNLTLKALPKFTAGSGATYQDIMLIKRDDLPVIVFDATGLSAPEKKISVGTYQSDASTAITSTYFFTQGYGSAFSDAESGDVVDPKDVFDVSGGTAVYVGTEVMASNDAQPLVAYMLAADGSLGELYVKDGTDIDTDIKALEKALSDAEAYCTVRLVKDITDVNATITVNKAGAPITLELDHCGISGSVSGALLTIESGTALTIVGSGETAKIENTNTSDVPKAILNNGTLTIGGVIVKGVTGIINAGILTVEDGTIEGSDDRGIGICNTGSPTPTATISGGSIKGLYGIDNWGAVSLTGGNIVSTGSGSNAHGIYNHQGATLTMGSSGDKSASVSGYLGIRNDGTLSMTAGTVEGTGGRGILIENTATATISGGSVKGTTGIDNYGSLTLSGGTVESTFSNAINNNSDATLCSIGAATITGSDHGIYIYKDVTLTAWPTITSGNYDSDIFLGTNNIVFASGFNAAADAFSPISVSVSKVGADNPFTSGFSAANTGMKAWEAFAFESTITFVDENSAGEAMLVRCDEEISFPEGLSTYYFDNTVKNLNGGTSLTFYAVTGVSGDKVIVKELTEKCIAAGTPIIVSNTSGQEQSFTFVNGNVEWKATEIGNNFLSDMNGTATSSYFKGTAEAKTAYVPDGGATMYGFNGEAFVRLDAKPDIAAHRCWLEIPQESGTGSQAGARSLTIGFGGDGDGTTGVREIKEVREVTDDTWYTLEGLKLSGKPQKKGIYVHGGRKVAIK